MLFLFVDAVFVIVDGKVSLKVHLRLLLLEVEFWWVDGGVGWCGGVVWCANSFSY